MLTPAEEQALQAAQLAQMAPGGMPLAPQPGEVFPSVTTSSPVVAGRSSSRREEIEGGESKQARLQADVSAQAAARANEVATLGTDAPAPPIKVAATPDAQPTGEGLSGGIRAGTTLAEQKDINAAALAATQKQLADEKAARMAALEQQRAQRVDAWLKEVADAKAEYQKASKITTLREDSGVLRNLFRALAAGSGAYASGLTGGPNHAQHILDQEVQQDMDKKKVRLQAAHERLQSTGANQALIDKWYDQQSARLLAEQSAKLDRISQAATVMLNRFPQAQAQAQSMIAAKKAEVDAAVAQRAKDVGKRVVESGTNTPASVTTVVQPGTAQLEAGRANKPTESEVKLALLGKSMQDELSAIRKGAKLTSSDLDQMQKDTLGAEAADKAAEGGQFANFGVAAGRSVGLTPKSRYGNLPPDKQKTANAWDNAVEKYARVLTGAGMPAEEARRMARQNIPMAGDSTDVIDMKLQRLENEASRFIALSGPASEKRLASTSSQPRQVPTQLTAAQMAKNLTAEERTDYADAKKVKPGDPDYVGAQKAIQKLEAKARGGK